MVSNGKSDTTPAIEVCNISLARVFPNPLLFGLTVSFHLLSYVYVWIISWDIPQTRNIPALELRQRTVREVGRVNDLKETVCKASRSESKVSWFYLKLTFPEVCRAQQKSCFLSASQLSSSEQGQEKSELNI